MLSDYTAYDILSVEEKFIIQYKLIHLNMQLAQI